MMDLREIDLLDFGGKRVCVLGLGIEGVDLARYLVRRGATVTVADSRPPEKLRERLRLVEDLPLGLELGIDPAHVHNVDAVFVSQSVPLDSPAISDARGRGVPVYSMVQMFLELAPGPVVGITGSSGKTTTTALVAEMFRADERPTFVGGNIGIGLLDHLDDIRPYTWSVLEISHTQLQLGDRSPHIAAVLNITPNHLDRFSWEAYKELKANLIRYQAESDIAVLNHDDPEVRSLLPLVKGRAVWFAMGPHLHSPGAFVRDRWVVFKDDDGERTLFSLDWLKLRGVHNEQNAVAAAAIAIASGVPPEAVACAAETFRGIPHRLDHVCDIAEVAYYNDSIATTPERTVAGLRSFSQPIVLLLGGRDKELPLEQLASEAAGRCRAIVLFGESAGKLGTALEGVVPRATPIVHVERVDQAISEAHRLAQPGDVVLFSPACTSYDAYDNFEQRGEHFCTIVNSLKEVPSSHP